MQVLSCCFSCNSGLLHVFLEVDYHLLQLLDVLCLVSILLRLDLNLVLAVFDCSLLELKLLLEQGLVLLQIMPDLAVHLLHVFDLAVSVSHLGFRVLELLLKLLHLVG